VHLRSRTGRLLDRSYPELVDALARGAKGQASNTVELALEDPVRIRETRASVSVAFIGSRWRGCADRLIDRRSSAGSDSIAPLIKEIASHCTSRADRP
jgi:hypothetical protein